MVWWLHLSPWPYPRVLYPETLRLCMSSLKPFLPTMGCSWWGTRGLFPRGSFSKVWLVLLIEMTKKGQFWYNCYTKMKHIISLGGHFDWRFPWGWFIGVICFTLTSGLQIMWALKSCWNGEPLLWWLWHGYIPLHTSKACCTDFLPWLMVVWAHLK